MDTRDAQLAHILRRTGFGIRPGSLEKLGNTDIHELIDDISADEGSWLSQADAESRTFEDDDDWDVLPREWLESMMSPTAGLHERMVWYWHNHFTTNRQEINHTLMWRQHQLMRRHALGNFRDFAREVLTDGAMLIYLDGAGSRGDAPNENLSREFLELFMVGRNAGYTEDDVRAAARILAGWWVDWDTSEVGHSIEDAYGRPVTFLGKRQRWSIDGYLDAVLALPECANHVAAGIHKYLVSTPLTAERRAQLGAVLRGGDWELRPLLSEILHSDDFVEARGIRTRQPVEWLLASALAFDYHRLDQFEFELWQLAATGQTPFEPPNVAGWPDDDRWSSATQVMARANTILNWELPRRLIDDLEPTPTAVLSHCGILEPSAETMAALDTAIADQTEYEGGLDLLVALTLISPEFATC